MTSLQMRSVTSSEKFEETNCRSGLFGKKYQISKTKRPNRIPDEGDIIDLKINCVVEMF